MLGWYTPPLPSCSLRERRHGPQGLRTRRPTDGMRFEPCVLAEYTGQRRRYAKTEVYAMNLAGRESCALPSAEESARLFGVEMDEQMGEPGQTTLDCSKLAQFHAVLRMFFWNSWCVAGVITFWRLIVFVTRHSCCAMWYAAGHRHCQGSQLSLYRD